MGSRNHLAERDDYTHCRGEPAMNTFDVSRSLWDYYLWASVLLAATLLAMLVIRQPARRMALAWAAAGGLLVLLVLTAVPNWSRYSLASPALSVLPVV